MKTRNLAINTFCLLALLAAVSVQAQTEYAKGAISIGLVVEDVEKSVDFYTQVLGMKEVSAFQVGSDKAVELGLSKGKAFDVKVLKTQDDENAAEWKIMSFKNKSEVCKDEVVTDANGMRYITLFVKSMAPVLENVKKHKVELLGETPAMLDDVRQFILVRDPDGTFIEVIGPK